MTIFKFHELLVLAHKANPGWLLRLTKANRPEVLTGLANPPPPPVTLSHQDQYTLATLVHAAESIPAQPGSFLHGKKDQYNEGVITDCEFVLAVCERIAEEFDVMQKSITGN